MKFGIFIHRVLASIWVVNYGCVRVHAWFYTHLNRTIEQDPADRWMSVCHCVINCSHHFHVNMFAILFITCFAYRFIRRLCVATGRSIVITPAEIYRRRHHHSDDDKRTNTTKEMTHTHTLEKGEWMILWKWHKFHAPYRTSCVCVWHTLSRHHMGSLISRFIVIVITIIIIWHKYSMNEALYWFTRIRFPLTLPIQIVCCVGLVPIKFSYRASEQQIQPV